MHRDALGGKIASKIAFSPNSTASTWFLENFPSRHFQHPPFRTFNRPSHIIRTILILSIVRCKYTFADRNRTDKNREKLRPNVPKSIRALERIVSFVDISSERTESNRKQPQFIPFRFHDADGSILFALHRCRHATTPSINRSVGGNSANLQRIISFWEFRPRQKKIRAGEWRRCREIWCGNVLCCDRIVN